MGKRRLGVLLLVLGLLLIFGAALLIAYNLVEDYGGEKRIQSALSQLPQADDGMEKDETSSGSGDEDSNLPSELPEELPDYLLHPDKEMPKMEIDGHYYVGTVTVPAIELKLPVIDHWSEADKKLMKIAPCRYVGSVYQNNMIIVGHNYTTHFGRLKNLRQGDAVLFTDVDGNVFQFEVMFLETIPGTGVQQMQSGDWDLTLFTCTIGGVNRVTVRCRAVKESELPSEVSSEEADSGANGSQGAN